MRRIRRVTAAVLGLTLGVPLAAQPARADDGLRWETEATYTFDSPAGVVRVRIEADLRNELPVERNGNVVSRPYVSTVTIPVHEDASTIVAAGDDVPLAVTLGPAENGPYQLAEIDLADLFSGQSVRLVVTYDLTGAPPRTGTGSRINPAYAAFLAYAVGDPGLTTVRVVTPEAFEVSTLRGEAVESVDAGVRVLTAAAIDDPQSWTMVVSARNDDALVSTPVTAGEAEFDLRAWPNDPEWATFVATTIEDGLPALEELIGRPWPIGDPLTVSESVDPYLYGYAGRFNGATSEIELGEELDAEVVLHELSHGWFGYVLFLDRWVNEGFAQTYANLALPTVGGVAADPPAADAASPAAVPLAVWGDVTPTSDVDVELETYGYDTSWFVIDALADEIGVAGMAEVVRVTSEGIGAYASDGVVVDAPNPLGATWRTLLDLAEEVGGSRGFEALVRQYVATDDDLGDLDARASARTAYDALETGGGEWAVPAGIRVAMGAWDFDHATAAIDVATAILASRDDVARKATDLGLVPPDAGLEEAYEQAGGGLANDTLADLGEVSAALDEQHLALADLFEVQGALDDAVAQLAGLGLTADGSALVAAPRAAFEDGRLDEVHGLVDASATEVAEWLATGEELAAAVAAADESRGFVERIGLIGTDVDGMVDDAIEAFGRGDRQRAAELTAEVRDALDGAGRAGTQRLLLGAGAAVFLLLVVLFLVRRRRARSAGDPSGAAEEPVGGVVGGVEQLDAQLGEGDVAGRAEAGEGREERQPLPPPVVEHEGHE